MKITPKYYQPLWKQSKISINVDGWEKTLNAWDNQQPYESILYLLDYINPELRTTYRTANENEFVAPHGSSIVHIKIDNEYLYIHCDLVNIEKAIKLPLLRKACELNFSQLNLAQLKLNDHQLYVYFKDLIEACNPHKIYAVLKEICLIADRYDDLFIEKFNAKHINEPHLIKLKNTDKIFARSITNAILDETLQYMRYFETQRWTGSMVDLLIIALKRIDVALAPQGYLKSELEQTHSKLIGGNISVQERIETGKAFIQFVKKMDAEDFDKHLYQTEILIPEKWVATNPKIIERLTQIEEFGNKYIAQQNYIGACMEFLYGIYDILYHNYLKSELKNEILLVLKNNAEKNWEIAARDFSKEVQQIITSFTS